MDEPCKCPHCGNTMFRISVDYIESESITGTVFADGTIDGIVDSVNSDYMDSNIHYEQLLLCLNCHKHISWSVFAPEAVKHWQDRNLVNQNVTSVIAAIHVLRKLHDTVSELVEGEYAHLLPDPIRSELVKLLTEHSVPVLEKIVHFYDGF